MSCDIGKVTERLENELCCISLYLWALFIIQPFRRFTYVTTHSPTLQSLYLRHSSFSNPSVALPTPQLILQSFRCFTYVTARSPTLLSLLLCLRLFTYVTWRAAHATATSELFWLCLVWAKGWGSRCEMYSGQKRSVEAPYCAGNIITAMCGDVCSD